MKDRAYKVARNHGYDLYHSALASMIYKFSDIKTGLRVNVNEPLAEELH